MQQFNFPIHMKPAFEAAIDAFAKDGFLYDSKITFENENIFVADIDASPNQIMSLGIKIGYRLPVKITDNERAEAILCVQTVIDTISKDDPETIERLQKVIRKMQQLPGATIQEEKAMRS